MTRVRRHRSGCSDCFDVASKNGIMPVEEMDSDHLDRHLCPEGERIQFEERVAGQIEFLRNAYLGMFALMAVGFVVMILIASRWFQQ